MDEGLAVRNYYAATDAVIEREHRAVLAVAASWSPRAGS